MFCERCGRIVDEDTIRCPECGNVLREPPVEDIQFGNPSFDGTFGRYQRNDIESVGKMKLLLYLAIGFVPAFLVSYLTNLFFLFLFIPMLGFRRGGPTKGALVSLGISVGVLAGLMMRFFMR